MPKLPKPTRESVFGRLAAAKSYWAIRVAEQNKDFVHYTLQQGVDVPDGFNVIHPPTGYSLVAAATDHIAGDGPQVAIPPSSLTQAAEDRSERLQKALNACLYRFAQETATNPVRTLVTNALWGGMMVSQGPLFDSSVWSDEPLRSNYDTKDSYDTAKEAYESQKKTKFPFWWRAIDPRYAFPDPGTNGKKWVLLNYRRTAGEIRAQWPKWKGILPQSGSDADLRTASTSSTPDMHALAGQLGGGTGWGAYSGMGGAGGKWLDTDLVEWVEYWDEEWRCYIAQSEVILVERHRYGKPPFQIRAAGFGNESTLPHERYRSLLYPARSFINQEIRAFCQLDAMMRTTAWTQMMTPLGSAFESLMPGTVVRMRPEDIQQTKAVTAIDPQVIQALSSEIGLIQQGIQAATYPAIVSGNTQGRNIPESGYGQQALVAQARVRFGPVLQQTESLLEEFVQDLLRCVDLVVKEDVPIWGKTPAGFVDQVLRPDDIRGYYYAEVTLNPKLPVDRANEVNIGALLLKMNAIDIDTFLVDFAGYGQPEEMRIKRMRDTILASPGIAKIMELAAIDKLGLLDWVQDNAAKAGLSPGQVLQAFGIFNPLTAQSPQASNGNGQAAPGTAQAATPAGATMFPTQQAQPTPGGPMDQAQVASAAGVAGLRG